MKTRHCTLPSHIVAEIAWRSFKYSSMEHIFHVVQLDVDSWCGVVGDGANGCYEWFIYRGGALETSDAGYGDATFALREVLNFITHHDGETKGNS
jgi:hypothetical protein